MKLKLILENEESKNKNAQLILESEQQKRTIERMKQNIEKLVKGNEQLQQNNSQLNDTNKRLMKEIEKLKKEKQQQKTTTKEKLTKKDEINIQSNSSFESNQEQKTIKTNQKVHSDEIKYEKEQNQKNEISNHQKQTKEIVQKDEKRSAMIEKPTNPDIATSNKVKIKSPDGKPDIKTQRPSIHKKSQKDIITVSEFNSLPFEMQKSISERMLEMSKGDQNLIFKRINDLIIYLSQFNNKTTEGSIEIKGDTTILLSNVNLKQCVQIRYFVTEILFESNSFENQSFINLMQMFDNISIEIKYPSDSFEKIFDKTKALKNTFMKQMNIGIFISGISKTDRRFENCRDINYLHLDKSVKVLRGSFWPKDTSFLNCSSL